jgi:hypothetical protein
MSEQVIPVPYSDLVVHVLDEPGHGGASHKYAVMHRNAEPSSVTKGPDEAITVDYTPLAEINFQNGLPGENGINGISNEALLTIVAHRLKSFQSGPYVSEDNRIALEHIEAANTALFNRTKDRLDRGVEGTHQL